jgi:hypothetical protein
MPDLELKVTPRAASDHVGPFRGGVLHLRVTRPPADGEANRSVVRLVARALGVAPGRIELVAGERGRRKRVRIADLDAAELARRLATLEAD